MGRRQKTPGPGAYDVPKHLVIGSPDPRLSSNFASKVPRTLHHTDHFGDPGQYDLQKAAPSLGKNEPIGQSIGSSFNETVKSGRASFNTRGTGRARSAPPRNQRGGPGEYELYVGCAPDAEGAPPDDAFLAIASAPAAERLPPVHITREEGRASLGPEWPAPSDGWNGQRHSYGNVRARILVGDVAARSKVKPSHPDPNPSPNPNPSPKPKPKPNPNPNQRRIMQDAPLWPEGMAAEASAFLKVRVGVG